VARQHSGLRGRLPTLLGFSWRELLGFAMARVGATPRAELAQFDPIRIVALVLDGGVVPLLAVRTLQGDDRTAFSRGHVKPNTNKT